MLKDWNGVSLPFGSSLDDELFNDDSCSDVLVTHLGLLLMRDGELLVALM